MRWFYRGFMAVIIADVQGNGFPKLEMKQAAVNSESLVQSIGVKNFKKSRVSGNPKLLSLLRNFFW